MNHHTVNHKSILLEAKLFHTKFCELRILQVLRITREMKFDSVSMHFFQQTNITEIKHLTNSVPSFLGSNSYTFD